MHPNLPPLADPEPNDRPPLVFFTVVVCLVTALGLGIGVAVETAWTNANETRLDAAQ